MKWYKIIDFNRYVYSSVKNPKLKEYRYVLNMIGGAKTLKKFILKNEPDIEYVSERQIKQLGGIKRIRLNQNVKHRIPKNADIIFKYLLKLMKEFEKNVTVNNNKNHKFRFCREKSINIKCNELCLEELNPGLTEKLENIIYNSDNPVRIQIAKNIKTKINESEFSNEKC